MDSPAANMRLTKSELAPGCFFVVVPTLIFVSFCTRPLGRCCTISGPSRARHLSPCVRIQQPVPPSQGLSEFLPKSLQFPVRFNESRRTGFVRELSTFARRHLRTFTSGAISRARRLESRQ